MKQNWERQKEHGKKKNSDESDFSEDEIPNLNSLKSFKFEPKTNIGDIISSSSDDEEEGAEYKVKRISNRVVQVQCKSIHWQMFFKIGVRPLNFIKKRL